MGIREPVLDAVSEASEVVGSTMSDVAGGDVVVRVEQLSHL